MNEADLNDECHMLSINNALINEQYKSYISF